MNTEPISRRLVVSSVAKELRQWDDLVFEVGEQRWNEGGFMGSGTFIDLAAHLTAWREHTLDNIEAIAEGKGTPATAWPDSLTSDDEINQWIQDQQADKSDSEILSAVRDTYARLADLVNTMTEELLNDLTAFPALEGESLAQSVVNGTFFSHLHVEHESSVRQKIRADAETAGTDQK